MKTFLVSVKEMNNDILSQLSKFGTVEVVVSKLTKIYSVKTEEKNKKEIQKLPGVIAIEDNRYGSFDV